jgi:hypothetical protein
VFASWLLAGTAASIAFFITNLESISRVVAKEYLFIVLATLGLSLIFGLISKATTIFVPYDTERQTKLREKIQSIMAGHLEMRRQIIESAKISNAPTPPALEISDVLTRFIAPMPWWTKLIFGWYLKKHASDPNIAMRLPLHGYVLQINLCALQSLCIIVAMIEITYFFMRT